MNGTAAAVMKKGTILFKDIHVREQHLTRKVNRESVCICSNKVVDVDCVQ
jgi:hypothetical protein